MSRQFQLRRGTTSENEAFIGAIGELTYDTETKTIRVHDSTTPGGTLIPKDTGLVHQTGDETITGTKTFSGKVRIATPGLTPNPNDPTTYISTSLFRAINPEVNLSNSIPTTNTNYSGLQMTDSIGHELGYIRVNSFRDYTDTKNVNDLELIAIDPDTTHTTSADRKHSSIVLRTDGTDTQIFMRSNTSFRKDALFDKIPVSPATNGILEIPQDIKLSASGATLTIQSGSKFYVPNGTGVFNDIPVTDNIQRTFTVTNATCLLFMIQDTMTFAAQRVSLCTSGTTPPSDTGVFYDTSANTIRAYSSGTVSNQKWSLPLAKITFDENGNITIDRVFNGFGFIGSLAFVLPNVKYLIPNGRNSDGTPLHITCITENVYTYQAFTDYYLLNNTGTIQECYCGSYIESETIPDFNGTGNGHWYNTRENRVYRVSNHIPTENRSCIAFTLFTDSANWAGSGKAIDIIPKYTFTALDRNDKAYIAHQAMPSNKYIDLNQSLGTSGTEHIAPTDGYVCLIKTSNDTNQYVSLQTSEGAMLDNASFSSASGQNLAVTLPVSKGQKYKTWWTAGGTLMKYVFIYSNSME